MVTSMIGAKNLITMGVFGIILNLLYLDAFSHHLLNLNPSCYFNEGNLVQQGVEPHKHLRVQSDVLNSSFGTGELTLLEPKHTLAPINEKCNPIISQSQCYLPVAIRCRLSYVPEILPSLFRSDFRARWSKASTAPREQPSKRAIWEME
jgi:hypothetical protein